MFALSLGPFFEKHCQCSSVIMRRSGFGEYGIFLFRIRRGDYDGCAQGHIDGYSIGIEFHLQEPGGDAGQGPIPFSSRDATTSAVVFLISQSASIEQLATGIGFLCAVEQAICYGEALYLREFAWRYKIMRSGDGMHFFQARDGRGLFRSLPSNNKGWHERFFFVSGEGWEYPPCEKNPIRVQQIPSTRSKETPELSPEEDSRVRRAGEKKPYDVAELLPPARVATSGGVSTDEGEGDRSSCPHLIRKKPRRSPEQHSSEQGGFAGGTPASSSDGLSSTEMRDVLGAIKRQRGMAGHSADLERGPRSSQLLFLFQDKLMRVHLMLLARLPVALFPRLPMRRLSRLARLSRLTRCCQSFPQPWVSSLLIFNQLQPNIRLNRPLSVRGL
ncbi:hypothetical protein CJ030_MR1G027739 [Morella rubra]|uniref:Uncharacterized protein n=1 Tax=Morella rubra TaxID=262757 RepID=A0A6A1WPE2_9ROSI|nr:hypothetical protein CJ030_MR1G027739 [Morella rubra]